MNGYTLNSFPFLNIYRPVRQEQKNYTLLYKI